MEKLDSVIVRLVLKMKEIVILMKSVKMVLVVDQTIVQLHLVLTLKLIVVINHLLEMKIFVHLEFHVEKMKEIVMLMMSVKMVLVVDQIIVQLHSVLTLKLIVVIQIHALVPVIKLAGKVITIVMMETTIVDVNMMVVIVVIPMRIWITAQNVNVLRLLHLMLKIRWEKFFQCIAFITKFQFFILN